MFFPPTLLTFDFLVFWKAGSGLFSSCFFLPSILLDFYALGVIHQKTSTKRKRLSVRKKELVHFLPVLERPIAALRISTPFTPCRIGEKGDGHRTYEITFLIDEYRL